MVSFFMICQMIAWKYIIIHGCRPLPSSTPKGNRRFGVLLLTKFSLKHKANQVLPATTEKIKFCLLN